MFILDSSPVTSHVPWSPRCSWEGPSCPTVQSRWLRTRSWPASPSLSLSKVVGSRAAPRWSSWVWMARGSTSPCHSTATGTSSSTHHSWSKICWICWIVGKGGGGGGGGGVGGEGGSWHSVTVSLIKFAPLINLILKLPLVALCWIPYPKWCYDLKVTINITPKAVSYGVKHLGLHGLVLWGLIRS